MRNVRAKSAMIKRLLVAMIFLAWGPKLAVAGDCHRLSSVCIDATPVKNIQGLNITVDQVGGCWAFEDTYQCRSAATVNDCQSLRDRGCVQIGATCVDKDDAGTCVMYEFSYQCPDKPETYTERTVCDQSAFCQDSKAMCFDTSAPPDEDFGQAAVMMEAVREAGVYGVDPDKVEIFKGYMEQCSIKVLGGATLKSCCKSTGGGEKFSNYQLLGAGVAVAGQAGREAVAMGSKYVYDALYGQLDSALMKKGLGAMNNWASAVGDGVLNPQFGFYGFTFEFSLANGFQFVGFDPSSFALQIGIMLVQEWLACDSSEQAMSMKRGQNLCAHVETYCSKKVLKVCVEKKERHCCFNSKLAKIINRQGRAQLGMAMNSCSGFNEAQLKALDFSRIDLSEFIADMIPKDANLPQMTNKVQQTVNDKVQGYYDQ
ncbi:conjugal transfer protein TraN [Mycetohabitans sp. B2]|nr:conjugal transfer protein TraN [Mycetohabitans sp. B2]